jgi:hypothetical protein
MRVNAYVFGFLVVAVFLGVIFGFQGAGLWSTSGKVDSSGRTVQAAGGDVETVKGWMTLEQVSIAFGIPVDEILLKFNLPMDTPPSTALKDLEGENFNIPALRAWLADRQTVQP